MKVIGYCRVSTLEQSDSGLGIAAQRQRIEAVAEQRGWEVTYIEDTGSGKDMRREGITRALGKLKEGEVGALVVAKLDRVTRSLSDFVRLMERGQRENWAMVSLDMGIDTTTPYGEAMMNMAAVFAQLERRLIGQRTSDALRAAQAKGTRLGRPADVPDKIRRRIVRMRGRGMALAKIADHLNATRVPTARDGARWYPSTVDKVVKSAQRDGISAY